MRFTVYKFCPLLLLFFTIGVYWKHAVGLSVQYGLSDFFRFYQSVLFYFSGQSIYSPTIVKSATLLVKASGDLNPPFFTVLFLPFIFLNYAQAFLVWTVFSILFTGIGVWLVLRPFPLWRQYFWVIFAFLLMYYPNQSNFDWGQVQPLLLCLLALAWLFARDHKDVPAGIMMGLACGIKLFCGLFLLYFWFTHRRRLFWITLLTLGITFILGGMVFGFGVYGQYFYVLNHIGWYPWTGNASLYGFVQRVFHSWGPNIPLVELPFLANVGAKFCWVLVMTLLIVWWRKSEKIDFDRGFSLTLVGMLLLSPLGWLYYFPVLMMAYLVLLAQQNDTVHLVAVGLLGLSTLMQHNFAPVTSWQVLWTGGIGFYVLVGMLLLLRRRYAVHRWMPEIGWPIVYGVVFIPSFVMLLETMK